MNYQQWKEAIQLLLVSDQNDSDLADLEQRMIEYGELRIYREFDFLATLASQTTTLSSSTRSVALPSNVIVCQALNVITPATTTNPDLGTRNPVTRASIDFLNAVYGSTAGAAIPKYFAEIGNPTIGSTITAGPINIVFGPTPNAAYTAEIIGTIRPSPLSASNPTTFITTYLPDLFIAACMVWGAGAVLQNYGQQSDDPKLAQSWEQQYQTLKVGVDIEELRKKSASATWGPYIPTPPANIPRERAAP